MILRRAQMAGSATTGHIPRERATLAPGRLARRHFLITLTKWLLPAAAAGLLVTIALWPDFDQHKEGTRFTLANVSGEIEGARMKHARYHGLDANGRPYTLTTEAARQLDSDRIELIQPQGDITEQGGAWLNLSAAYGIYQQKANVLALSRDVALYRDDGTTLTTGAATLDIKNGGATGQDPVHAEGPFGVLDAQGFIISDRGAALRFIGPARVVLEGATP